MGIDTLIAKILEQENVGLEEIRMKTKQQKISDIRKIIVLLAVKHCETTSTELANKFNLQVSMISKIKARGVMRTDYMEEIMGIMG